MSERWDSGSGGVRRRAVLASAAAGATGLAGCLSRFRTVRNQQTPEQLSLEILTLPGDYDDVSTQIARRLANNFEAVGVDVELTLFPQDELRRQVLINQEYDLFVMAHPAVDDPDVLRPLLHSSFVSEIGWQNPFKYTDINIDELLDDQRKAAGGGERREAVNAIQHEIARQQPLIPVVVPDDIRASRSDRFTGWRSFSPDFSLALLGLDQHDDEVSELRLVSTDGRMTRNLNPIAIEYRNRGKISGLLYDPLARHYSGSIQPWAAHGWAFSEDAGETVCTVTLRSDIEFHDGTPLTADDVIFTVEFFKDTSLGEFEVPVPAPRYRGRVSVIDDISALDEHTLEIRFGDTSRDVARRALTIPVFSSEVWQEKSRAADIGGVEISQTVTEALVWSNEEPIGSGPFKYKSSQEGEELVLTRHENHFLNRDDVQLSTAIESQFAGGDSFESLSIRIVRSDDAALSLLVNDEVDAVISNLSPSIIPQIGREPEVELRSERSHTLYLVGCHASREPLGNPNFRRIVARLIDKEAIFREVFGGFGTPAASPLAGTEWLAPELRMEDTDPEVPFFGNDGQLDVEAAREELRAAGFEFSEDGDLLEQ